MWLTMPIALCFVATFFTFLTVARSSSDSLPSTISSATTFAPTSTYSDLPLPNNPQNTSSYVQAVKPAYSNVFRYLKNCNGEEAKLEGMIWEDHRRLAEYASKWDTQEEGKGTQLAIDMYVGGDANTQPWSDDIKFELRNQLEIHNYYWYKPYPDSIFIYCNEKGVDSSPNGGPYKGNVYFYIQHGAMSQILEEKSLIDTVLNNIKGGHGPKDNATYITSQVYAQTYYHEFGHQSPLVNRTRYEDNPTGFVETNGPIYCEDLAKNFGCKGRLLRVGDKKYIWVSSMYNPDSFATFATVAYFSNALGLDGTIPPNGAGTSSSDYAAYFNSTRDSGQSPRYLPPLNSSADDVSFLGYNPDVVLYNQTESDYAWDYTPPSASPIPSASPLSDPGEIYHSTTTQAPGRGGIPGCAYIIAADLGTGALCSTDYCNCGGIVAPLLTQTVSGTQTTGCAYQTQPVSATCDQPSFASAAVTTSPSASLYCSNPSPEDGDGLCTCIQGTVTKTVTPLAGICPTSL